MTISLEMVASAFNRLMPDKKIIDIQDRGVWIRHNFHIRLDGGEAVYLKADLDPSYPAGEKEEYICALLSEKGLPAPKTLVYDDSGKLLPVPFIIQEYIGGSRLGDLMNQVDKQDRLDIYKALGCFYKKLHSIHYDHSGWLQGAGTVLPFSPNRYQFNEVILKIGNEAVEKCLLSNNNHLRLQRLWSDNMSLLEQHKPSLVGGASHWAIYLSKEKDWKVIKILDLHDFLYWDPAWDIASIKYPEFAEQPSKELWEAFTSEYGCIPSEKRLFLYVLMRRLDAAMGNYLEPSSPENEYWKEQVWETFEKYLEKAESL
jgi:hypothetical protein